MTHGLMVSAPVSVVTMSTVSTAEPELSVNIIVQPDWFQFQLFLLLCEKNGYFQQKIDKINES